MVYEINLSPNDLDSTFALLNSLFGTIKLSKNADPDKFLILDSGLPINGIVGVIILCMLIKEKRYIN